jgi:hypothetical protein
MNTQTNELDRLIVTVMNQITAAASNQDIPEIQRLSRRAAELHELKEQTAAIQHRIASFASETKIASIGVKTTKEQTDDKARELVIEVTDGDIRQNLLKLTPHIKNGKIKLGEEIIVEALPNGELFQTVVSDKGNKLRARGEIARFYKEARVKGGDYVLLTETAPGRWTLKKAPPGEYGISRLLRDL